MTERDDVAVAGHRFSVAEGELQDAQRDNMRLLESLREARERHTVAKSRRDQALQAWRAASARSGRKARA
jgi:hypothetical protein